MNDFCRPFQNNEALYKQAQSFWNQLESSSIVIVLIFAVLGILMAYTYYQPFNNKPGRHYKPKYWVISLAVTFVLTLAVTFGFEYFAHAPKLKGSMLLEFKIAIANSLYATLLYVVVSWVWCQFKLPTNAYRLIKF